MAIERSRLEQAWGVFKALYLERLAPSTRRQYASSLRRLLQDLPERFELGDLVRWQRVTMLGELRYSVAYCNVCTSLMRSMARRASVVTGDVELASVVGRLELVRAAIKPPRCPPPDALPMALEACRDPAERAFLMLAGLAGLRRNEILGLMPTDYDAALGVLQVVRQRHMPWRKNRRPHSVCIDARELRDALEWTIANRARIGRGPGWFRGRSAAYLFPWAQKRVEGLLRRIRAHVGPRYLPRGWGWHAFRHWGATELARRGASISEVQSWLGDSSPDIACSYNH